MTAEVKGEIARFNTIGTAEWNAAALALTRPLSGYLAGNLRGGPAVWALEEAWAERFEVKHAIACNSATSGLMAAAFAVGLKHGDRFAVSPYTMSATVTAPMFTGATPLFIDVEDNTFCMDTDRLQWLTDSRTVVITNLFGHPSEAMDLLPNLSTSQYLIEDNSQSPFAMERGCYAGTFGNIGVFSLNVHKHIQCGEGGVCVTDDDELAEKLRHFINHGEMASASIGLNLRLPEVSAAIALAQLNRANEIIGGRIEQAEAILDAIGHIPGISQPIIRKACLHVFYTIPFLINIERHLFVEGLRAEGVPLVEGYVEPLYRLPPFAKFAKFSEVGALKQCQVAEGLHDRRLFMFENCAWSPTKKQIKQIGNAFQKVAEKVKL